MTNHYLPVDIPHGEKTHAYCSFLKPKRLIVFVHGFNGDSNTTWASFSDLTRAEDKFKDADILFFGYETLKSQANNMCLTLYDLLSDCSNPANAYYPNRPQANTAYQEIILICHSLGAVVARLALLYAYDDNAAWLSKCKMLFYAPAHFASRIPENFRECFSGLGGTLFRAFAVTKYPIIKDLTENSELLQKLHKRTKELIDEGKGDFTKASIVVWAENETVVVNERFHKDSLEKQIVNSTHVSVCKPATKDEKAFQYLLKLV